MGRSTGSFLTAHLCYGIYEEYMRIHEYIGILVDTLNELKSHTDYRSHVAALVTYMGNEWSEVVLGKKVLGPAIFKIRISCNF